jgi:hypothetical protein
MATAAARRLARGQLDAGGREDEALGVALPHGAERRLEAGERVGRQIAGGAGQFAFR